jgi:outer membrane immunogenic protein
LRKFAILFVALAFSAPAFAADMAVKAPPPAPTAAPFSWTSFYVGAELGGKWADP